MTLLALAVFAVTWSMVALGLTRDIDRAIMLWVRNATDPSNPWGPAGFEEMAAEITALGGYTILVLIVGLVAINLVIISETAMAWFLLAAFATGSAVSSLLKIVIERPRPDLVERLDRVFTASFPSGHAMVSMIAYLTLAAVVVRLCKTRKLRIFVLVAAASLSIAIGVSRIYLGVHWPSDVLAGWSIGVAWAGICWLAAHYLESRLSNRWHKLGQSDL